MYARPYNRAAHDRFWELIRNHLQQNGVAAPDGLDHETDPMAVWGDPDLVLSQICNLPYRLFFRDRLTRIGAADYGLDGCAPGFYRSVFVVRRQDADKTPKDFAQKRFAYNDQNSQAGFGAAQLWASDRGFQFRPSVATGSHAASITVVAKGAADIAAIDAQSWRVLSQDLPETGQLAVIGHSHATPGMTFVTRADQEPAPFLHSIRSAIAELSPQDGVVLGICGIVPLPPAAYDLPFPPNS